MQYAAKAAMKQFTGQQIGCPRNDGSNVEPQKLFFPAFSVPHAFDNAEQKQRRGDTAYKAKLFAELQDRLKLETIHRNVVYCHGRKSYKLEPCCAQKAMPTFYCRGLLGHTSHFKSAISVIYSPAM